MNAQELINLIKISATPIELVAPDGTEYLIGEELTIREDEATKDDIILYNPATGETVADGGYLVTADHANILGLTYA